MIELIGIGALSLPLAGTTFVIDLPGDASVRALVEHVGRPALSDRVHRGPLIDVPGGWYLFVTNGDAVAGEVSAPGFGHYHVRDSGNGDARIVRIDPSGRLDCRVGVDHLVWAAPSCAPSWPPPRPEGPVDTCGESVVVDVMFVYSAQAEALNGGQAAIEAVIDSYVEYVNMVYEASGIGHRFRLVHAQQISYNDSGNILTDLDRLRNPSDGQLDDVHPLRDAWGADLVTLISDTPSAGVAYGMQRLSVAFESSAFSVLGAQPEAITGGLVYGHETGHNMGCQHNNVPMAPLGLFCYSFGHRTRGPQWRTIMSNPPGTFVDFFSSPDLSFDGFPLGVPGDGCPVGAADAVRTLNASAATVAMFRPTVVPLVCPGDVTGDGLVNIDDVVLVILNWGPCSPGPDCPGDANGDLDVDVDDVVVVVLNWTG